MTSLDLTLPTPAENLACDEALLDQAEQHGGPSVLRCWESPSYFVVLGYANRWREEVNVTACQEENIPILRRCSGGGTVLQGPGCLNYCLVLDMLKDGPLETVTQTNRFIMRRNADALASLLARPIEVEGCTDLALGQLKFSGNAQRRRRRWLLFHGTILLDFDVQRIERALRPPPRQPAYRRDRSHAEFLTQLKLPAAVVKQSLCAAWDAAEPAGDPAPSEIQRLVRERYGTEEWSFKW